MAIKKNREIRNEERNQKIKDMDWEEVKRYLCMKNNQNPEKCPGCLGLSTCTAGQRVMVLMDERKKKEEAEKQAGKPPVKPKRRYAKNRGDDYIRQVCAAEDPREYLMKAEGLTWKQARKKLENWRRNHPDLFVGVTWTVKHRGINMYTKGKENMEESPVTEPIEEKEEVSVEDFLNDTMTIDADKINLKDVETEIPEKRAEEKTRTGTEFYGGLEEKLREMERKEAELRKQLARIEQIKFAVQTAIDLMDKGV